MAPDRSNVFIDVVVRAENEDDQQYEWSEGLAISDQVAKLVDAWAQAHGVPMSAVGLDDANGCQVDLSQTPLSLGWIPGSTVYLTAFPTEDRFMEQIGQGEDGQDRFVEQIGQGEDGQEAPAPGQGWNPQAAPSEDLPAPVAAGAGAEAFVAPAAASSGTWRAPAASASEVPGEAAGSAEAGGTSGPARTTARKAAAAEANNGGQSRGRGRARGGGQQQDPKKGAKGGGGASAASAPAGRGRGGRGGSAAAPACSRSKSAAAAPALAAVLDVTSTPTDAEAIAFEQANPKKQGTNAYNRYERYKRARTVSEALSLGAAKGDIAHDFKRGFLKRRRVA